jgi:hypothetical protein
MLLLPAAMAIMLDSRLMPVPVLVRWTPVSPNAVSGDFGLAAHPLFANKPANWIRNHYGGVTHYF